MFKNPENIFKKTNFEYLPNINANGLSEDKGDVTQIYTVNGIDYTSLNEYIAALLNISDDESVEFLENLLYKD